MCNNKIKILDIEFDKKLVNINEISKREGLNQSHISLLINNKRTNNKLLKKLRNAIVKNYGEKFIVKSKIKNFNTIANA